MPILTFKPCAGRMLPHHCNETIRFGIITCRCRPLVAPVTSAPSKPNELSAETETRKALAKAAGK